MKKVFIHTDTHLGHRMLIDKGYRSADYEERIYRHLKQLQLDDVLIHLGDVCLGAEAGNHKIFHSYAKCQTKILVRGNHDHKSNAWYLEHGWTFVCESFSDKYFGKRIIFSHVPIPQTNDFDLNIHGHLHDNGHRLADLEKAGVNFSYNSEWHRLLAIEYTNYGQVSLEALIAGRIKNGT